jgi:hypothetical protein
MVLGDSIMEKDELQTKIAKTLRDSRKNSRFSLKDLTVLCLERGLKISTSQLNRIENGLAEIGIVQLLIFCEIFCISLNSLLDTGEIMAISVNMEIVITQDGKGYRAQLEGHPEVWGDGKSESDAITNIIRANRGTFRINIKR